VLNPSNANFGQIQATGFTSLAPINGTLTLTKAAAFTDYTFLSGDTIEITSGTGAGAGVYEVASRPTANTITLTATIGAAADGQTDIAGIMLNNQVALSSDFDIQSITGYAMSDGLVRRMQMVSPQDLADLRSWDGRSSLAGFYALVNYVRSTAGGQPSLRIDHWPETADTDEVLVIRYRGGWIDPADDDDIITIPNWVNGLFIEVFKGVVRGHEEPQSGSVDQRLLEVQSGVLFVNAVNRDAMLQPDLGGMRGSWLEDSSYMREDRFPIRGTIGMA